MSRRLETVRTFAKYICVFDKQAQMPPKGLFGKCHGRTTPYVFSELEICKIMTETSNLFSPDGLRALTIPTAIGLMWSTGMRPSKVCNLRNSDVDLLNEFITVNETKFSKSRVFPIHRTTVEKLREYLCNRNHLLQCNISEYFFISTGGKELKLRNFENALQLTRVSLLSSKESCWNRRPPRLYDVRHSFACNTIHRWYKEGVDVNSKISYLSTYMGHVKIQDTYWYLTGTPEFNIDCIIPEDDSVRLLSQSVEEMDLTELYMTYSRVKENQPTPRQMLKIMMYANMSQIYSSRPIERACKRDINFMFLLEGKQAPDHATIARFRSLHFVPISKEMLAKQVGFLKEICEIFAQQIFIDGTKIESVANKYTSVWKKSVTKHQVKLMEKISVFVQECEELFGIRLIYQNEIQLRHLKKKLYKIKSDEGIEFVHGIGKRKTPLQKSVETLEEWLERLKKYMENLHILGERNSYSKTDKDATFMRMKEDAMLNGQLKPGYNLQVGVDSEYIVWLTVGPQPTDTTTLIPFLKEMETYLGFKYEKIVADAGYESEENYLFLERNGQFSYIKPANYEISKTQKYKKDIGRLENMTYIEDGDYYVCRNNKNLVETGIRKKKSKTGYESIKTCYSCEDCNGSPHKSQCIKGNNCKNHWRKEQRTWRYRNCLCRKGRKIWNEF